MDSEALKIILQLKEENTLLHRAIVDAAIMLDLKKKHFILRYDDPDISFLFLEIGNILKSFEEVKQPSDKCNKE
jgi:hypothetical protein